MKPWAKLKSFFSKSEGPDTETGPKADRISHFESPWTRFADRKAMWRDLEAMDRNDPIVHASLDFLARFATTFPDRAAAKGFDIEGPDDELELLRPLTNSLQVECYEHVRYALKFADMFGENIVGSGADGLMRIRGVKMFPYSYQIQINADEYGRMRNGSPQAAMASRTPGLAAYDQTDDNGMLIAAFNPYQITQLSFGHKQGLRYTEPHLASIISTSKRLQAMRDGLAIARLDRAYQTRLHRILAPKGKTDSEAAAIVEQYKKTMSKDLTVPYDTDAADFKLSSRESPSLACTDLYVLRMYTEQGQIIDGDIENLPADNANLQNLEDVFLAIREVLCGTGVPADFLNLSVGQRAFIDKMSSERREGFLYLGSALSEAYLTFVRWILELQMLLFGKAPWETSYRIVGPRISPREAEIAAKIAMQRAQTAAIWKKLGIPNSLIGSAALQLTPSEIEEWERAAKAQTGATEVAAKQLAQDWVARAKLELADENRGGQLALVEGR